MAESPGGCVGKTGGKGSAKNLLPAWWCPGNGGVSLASVTESIAQTGSKDRLATPPGFVDFIEEDHSSRFSPESNCFPSQTGWRVPSPPCAFPQSQAWSGVLAPCSCLPSLCCPAMVLTYLWTQATASPHPVPSSHTWGACFRQKRLFQLFFEKSLVDQPKASFLSKKQESWLP